MHSHFKFVRILGQKCLSLVILSTLLLSSQGAGPSHGPAVRLSDVIVQGTAGTDLAGLVAAQGGYVTRDLAVIDAVAAHMPASQVEALRQSPGVRRVWQDAAVQALGMSPDASGSAVPDTEGVVDQKKKDWPGVYEALNAAPVWAAGNTGAGVGVAVLDSGVKKYAELTKDSNGDQTGLARGYSALAGVKDGNEDDDQVDDEVWARDGMHDPNGHGTMVASAISNVRRTRGHKFLGVAPDSTIIPVQVLDKNGQGSYSQVIEGIQWVIDHRHRYNIRVMNVSLNAPVRSWYWDDPLNQAIMQAWKAGIVVVVAAGNKGPGPMTVGVPGNVPYVITVGALTDAYTPNDWSDDTIPEFSAAGPTVEAFVKPDLVAPGGHITGLMPPKSKLAKEHPESRLSKNYYAMSGTSMSAAQVSGVVALMLAQEPDLHPDEVKYRLMAAARPARAADGACRGGTLAYSVWQQGAGRADAYGAVYGDHVGRANRGLDVAADLGLVGAPKHYVGHTRWDAETERFYLQDAKDHVWGGTMADIGGFVWSEGLVNNQGFVWGEAYAWGGGFVWSEAFTWGDASPGGAGFVWSDASPGGAGIVWSEAVAGLVVWVPSE